jgi:hypothetical protein
MLLQRADLFQSTKEQGKRKNHQNSEFQKNLSLSLSPSPSPPLSPLSPLIQRMLSGCDSGSRELNLNSAEFKRTTGQFEN